MARHLPSTGWKKYIADEDPLQYVSDIEKGLIEREYAQMGLY